MYKRQAEAETMILALAQQDENGDLPDFRKVHVTETTKGIVVLGFQDKIEVNEEGEVVVIEEGLTFNVDVAWKTVNEDWDQYEVQPLTSNHSFYN